MDFLIIVDSMEAILTVVIPIDLGRRADQLLSRLLLLLNALDPAFRIMIGHNDRGTRHDASLRKIVQERGGSNISLCSVRLEDDSVNNAALRNAAFWQVDTEFALLLDADIYCDNGL